MCSGAGSKKAPRDGNNNSSGNGTTDGNPMPMASFKEPLVPSGNGFGPNSNLFRAHGPGPGPGFFMDKR